jgi:subtilisin family serine protease
LNQNASSVVNIGITGSQTKNIHGTASAAVANNGRKVAGAAKQQRQLAMQSQQEC